MIENLEKLNELIEAMLDKSITPQQCSLLQQYLLDSAQARQYYLDYVLMCTILRQNSSNYSTGIYQAQEQNKSDSYEINPFREIIEKELEQAQSNSQQYEHCPQSETVIIHNARSAISFHGICKVLGAIAAIIAIVFILEFSARLSEQRQPVSNHIAFLNDSIDAQWRQEPLSNHLRPGLLELLSGLAEIKMNDGSIVVLEGPCIIRLEASDQILLEQGRILARCDDNIGFTVHTPLATIVDYGTEFGVVVEDGGQTRAFVFEGQVDFRAGSQVKVYPSSMRLYAGQAATLDSNNVVYYFGENDRFVHNLKQHQENLDILAQYSGNLIVNGDFEADKAGTFDGQQPIDSQITNIDITGWQDDTVATIFEYERGTGNFINLQKDIVPPNRDQNYFIGVGSNIITQNIDISALEYWTDSGRLAYNLSGWLGGYQDHDDSCELIIDFLDTNGNILGSDKIGPIKAADRNNKSGFIECKVNDFVPVGSVSVKLSLKSIRVVGIADAYADNLELFLNLAF